MKNRKIKLRKKEGTRIKSLKDKTKENAVQKFLVIKIVFDEVGEIVEEGKSFLK